MKSVKTFCRQLRSSPAISSASYEGEVACRWRRRRYHAMLRQRYSVAASSPAATGASCCLFVPPLLPNIPAAMLSHAMPALLRYGQAGWLRCCRHAAECWQRRYAGELAS